MNGGPRPFEKEPPVTVCTDRIRIPASSLTEWLHQAERHGQKMLALQVIEIFSISDLDRF